VNPPVSLDSRDIELIASSRHGDPFSILGPHEVDAAGRKSLAIRAFNPGAIEAWVIEPRRMTPMKRLHDAGFFGGVLDDYLVPFRDYQIRFRFPDGAETEFADPYCYPPTLSDFDLHLLAEGTHYRNYDRLGAHLRVIEGAKGVTFAVWAPTAERVSVVGDFNGWDGRRHPMRFHPGAGLWELFIPDLGVGVKYKFEIVSAAGVVQPLRADPYGFEFELRPNTAAIVSDLDGFHWSDDAWMQRRGEANAESAPILVYEVHLGSWSRDPSNPERLFTYGELADRLIPYVKDLGYTHIQLLPVAEHPYDGSWGYQVLGYYAPTSRFGTPKEFMAFVDRCHAEGLGVFLDWVPAHFPRDSHGLRLFDGTACYEHADPRQGEHPEWGTMVFNFGRNEVANFLISNALYWLEKYHIDGLRVDAVASMLYLDYGRKSGEWIPNEFGGNHNLVAAEFLKRFNTVVHERFPTALTIAEESTSWRGVSHPVSEGGLGFSLKWNMGWMNDTLKYIHREPIHRRFHQNDLTFSLIYAFNERFMLPLSHDEVVHGKGSLLDKMPGDPWQKFANLRLLLGYMYTHPGKKLLFMGGEFGQWQEWRFYQSLDWHLLEMPEHRGVRRWATALNALVRNEPALHELDFSANGFEWIDIKDHDNCVISYLRKDRSGGSVLIVCNFTPAVLKNYRVGAPKAGVYRRLACSDDAAYGGSGVCGPDTTEAITEPRTVQNRPFVLTLTLPPLGCLVFQTPRDG
jgi:1,4-alpha-glucan branching enzyme